MQRIKDAVQATRLASPSTATQAKRVVAQTSLLALGVTFNLCSRYVPAMQKEIETWPEGFRVGIGVLPEGPRMTLEKREGRIHYLGMDYQDPVLKIQFKNLDSAVLIFTGQLGAPLAVAENRVTIEGNNGQAMQVTRAMAIVQTYLFPGLILNATFKRPPKLSLGELATKAKIMALLTPYLVGNAWK